MARQHCKALGKRSNCQITVSVHTATDTASCPLEWELFLPGEWADDGRRHRRAEVPDKVRHAPKRQLALGLLDRLAAQGPTVPVIMADAGYGRSISFRLSIEERGWSYVMAVDPKEIARPAAAKPCQPAYGGLGPPTLPRYREPGLAPDLVHHHGHLVRTSRLAAGQQGMDDEPARQHTHRRPGPVGEDALAHRTRLPRAQARALSRC
ncbi:transposase [Streptomyces sp. NPDC015184]|uniref:transposase n=1 Tax=Streptomyces sp. NPDC015184 TaxID=3364946 RepID=UPI0036F9B64D